MIKILQTGDVHLGAKFEGLGEKGVAQRKQIERVFERLVQVALDKKVDLFLVTGDLFDGDNPPQSAVDFVRRQLDRLIKKNIITVIIPGNHDFLSDRSVYKNNFWNEIPSIFVFNDPKIEKKELPDFDLAIYAKVLVTKNSTESPILKVSPSGLKHNIMIAHGSFISSQGSRDFFFDQWPITPEEIKNSSMDYIAIGNFHGMQDVSQGDVPAWYSGSPEVVALDQENAGFVLLVTIDGEPARLDSRSSGKAKIEPIKVGERKFDQVEIILDNIVDSNELKNKILEGADVNLIRKVFLSGFSVVNIFIDEEALEGELGDKFFKLIVIDKTVPQIPELDSGKYSSDLIVGQFIALAKEKIEKSTSESEKDMMQKVLQLGLSELER